MNQSELTVLYFLGVFVGYIAIRIFTNISRLSGTWTKKDRILAMIVSSGSWLILPAYLTLIVITLIDRDYFYREGMDKDSFI